jgi:GAF domain-containing protein
MPDRFAGWLPLPDPVSGPMRNLGEMVVSSGMAGIVAALSRDAGQGLQAVSAASCAEVLGMTGIAVSVLTSGGGDVVWRTDGVGARLDDLQFTLGEGPGVDAAASGELVLEPDLSAVPVQRWPMFISAALELGVRAVFAVPLQIGAICVGVLLAQRDTPGPLGGELLADLLVFAGAAAEALLRAAAGAGPEPRWLTERPSGYRAEVHQASGMISVQLGVGQAEALIRLRAYAFSHRRALAEVAADVVARRMRFDEIPD